MDALKALDGSDARHADGRSRPPRPRSAARGARARRAEERRSARHGRRIRGAMRGRSSPPMRRTSRRRGPRGRAPPSSTACALNPSASRPWPRPSRASPSCPIRSAACSPRLERPNGLLIERVATPLGVIGVIFESRPNVTADAGALCLKAGNAAILRAGSDSFRTSIAIAAAMRRGLEQAGLPGDAIQLVPTRDRAAVGAMLAGPRRQHRRDRAARRQEPRRARAGRGARAGLRASRGICHVYVACRGRSRHGEDHRAQRQDAAHRRLRRGRDPAGRPGLRRRRI